MKSLSEGGDVTQAYKMRRSKATSAARALDVLEYFGQLGRPLRAKEIVREFGLASSTAEQLLKTMVEAGYLVFDAQSKLYDMSFRLTRFARGLAQDCFLGSDMSPVLDDLCQRTEANVYLAQRTDNFMRVVEMRAPVGKELGSGDGLLLPLDAMTGQAFLASCEDKEATRIVAHAARHRHLAPNSAQLLVERVRAVRSAGYAMGAAHSVALRTVSMPLCYNASRPTRTLVLSITGTEEGMMRQQDHILVLLHEWTARLLQGCEAVSPAQDSRSDPL